MIVPPSSIAAGSAFQTFASTPNPWERINGILVINLDSRPDRLDVFMEQTGRFLPKEKLHRLSAVTGTGLPGYGQMPWFSERTADRSRFWAGAAGCALSHRRAIERARLEGWNKVLILEDDARLLPEAGGWDMFQQALQSMREEDMLYLGHNQPVPYGFPLSCREKSSLWQVEGVLATHAYVMSGGLYEKVLSLLPKEEDIWEWVARHKAVDEMYREFLPNLSGVRVTALYPLLFNQGAGVSDIGGNCVDGQDYSCSREPYPYQTVAGWVHRLMHPFHRLKVRLNAQRRYLRACRGGLPGHRKRSSASAL